MVNVQEPALRRTVESPRALGAQRWLAAFAVCVNVGHHLGVLLAPLGDVGTTRWADWVDLAVPYAVVACGAGALAAGGAGRRAWLLLGAAAVAYTQGHGIHLAANSIGNVDPGEAAHLWDEVVGHYVWYGGLAGIVAALALALDELPRPASAAGYALAVLFGLTVFTNSVEGGTPLLGLATSVVFVAWGFQRRLHAPVLLLVAYSVAALGLLAWGVYWRGFPQFSELGWI